MARIDHIRERMADPELDWISYEYAKPNDEGPGVIEWSEEATDDFKWLLEKVRMADELAKTVAEYYGPPAVRLALTAYQSE